jgi:two-component system, NarL family, sensor histidine kinase DesK
MFLGAGLAAGDTSAAGLAAGDAASVMAISLAPLNRGRLSWRVVHRSKAEARPEKRQGANWIISLASLSVASYAAALPTLQLYRIAIAPIDQTRAGYALAATVLSLPWQVWLVWSAARGVWGRVQRWALGGLAVLIVGVVPLAGVDGLGGMYVLAALVLISVSVPWSLLAFVVLVLAPIPVAFQLGQPQWASYFSLGVLLAGVPLAVVVRLIRAARQLEAARSALAEQAVIRERLRIDAELRQTVGSALEAIVAYGNRAQMTNDLSAKARELRDLVDATRRTLAEARTMVMRYQNVSLRAELEAAATLLAAAGIRTRLLVPGDEPSAHLDDAMRSILRDDVARVLSQDSIDSIVTIAVDHHHGQAHVELRRGEADPTGTDVTAR